MLAPALTPVWPRASLYVALHTEQPTEASQDSNELDPALYSRGQLNVSDLRLMLEPDGEFVLVNDQTVNFVLLSRRVEIRWFSIGTERQGRGRILAAGPLDYPLKTTGGYVQFSPEAIRTSIESWKPR